MQRCYWAGGPAEGRSRAWLRHPGRHLPERKRGHKDCRPLAFNRSALPDSVPGILLRSRDDREVFLIKFVSAQALRLKSRNRYLPCRCLQSGDVHLRKLPARVSQRLLHLRYRIRAAFVDSRNARRQIPSFAELLLPLASQYPILHARS